VIAMRYNKWFWTAVGWIGGGLIATINFMNGNVNGAVWTVLAIIIGQLFSFEKRLSRIETILLDGGKRDES